jgi:catechol 2,3-dioxygenase-like lactoylglutathione lyase family enzyme
MPASMTRATIDPNAERGSEGMLANSPVHPVLLSKDLTQTRDFYHDKLGLEILVENQVLIEFRCGGGTKLTVTASTTGTADEQTQIRWEVQDLRAELFELRSRGVVIEEYDLPGVKTENGIADMGFAWIGWITDPGKNVLAIFQRKS